MDEALSELDCDGVDDDCDGSVDEQWSQDASLWALCEDACPTAIGSRPGHYACIDGRVECIFEPNVDYCASPGRFPNPFEEGTELFCGAGPGETCNSEEPCFAGLNCDDGTCTGTVNNAAVAQCILEFRDPAMPMRSCQPQRGYACGW